MYGQAKKIKTFRIDPDNQEKLTKLLKKRNQGDTYRRYMSEGEYLNFLIKEEYDRIFPKEEKK